MKILFLTGWYPHKEKPNHGVFVRDQAAALGKNYEILVVSARVRNSSFGIFSFDSEEHHYQGVREISVSVHRSLPVFNQLNFFIVAVYATCKAAKAFRPDIIHGNIGYPGAFWSWTVSKFLKVPYLITEHTKITNNFRSGFHKFLTVFGLKRASAIVAVSPWHATEIKNLIHRNVYIIGNIIRSETFKHVAAKRPGKPVHFGLLGGMDTNVKGIDLLLHACAGLKDDFVLHIGGIGKFLETYKILANHLGIGNKCIFHGFVEHSRVPDFMSQLHFFVSASRSETFGMVMAEAMASGLPVVATDSGGSGSLIKPENGILVSADSAEALTDGINQMMNTYVTYDTVKIRKSVKEFSEEKFLLKTGELYSKVLES